MSRLFNFIDRKFIKYGIVGGSGVFIHSGFLWIGKNSGLPIEMNLALTIWTSTTINFLWNRFWTFEFRGIKGIWKQYGVYLLCTGLGGIISYTSGLLLVRGFYIFSEKPWLVSFASIPAGASVNYILNRYWTFSLKIVAAHDRRVVDRRNNE